MVTTRLAGSLRHARHALIALAAILMPGIPAASAQDYPNRPIRVIVPAAPGGALDRLSRMISDKLQARWRQPVIAENRPGGGGNVGAEFVFKAAPDGYTLLFTDAGQIALYKNLLYPKLAFDPDAFAMVSLVTRSPAVLVVHPKVPEESVQQLVAYARAHPDRLNYASAGNGTTLHLAGELFKAKAGVKIVHVPYKGSGPALTDLLGGQVDMMFHGLGFVLPHIRAGKLRPLGIGTEKRNPLLPDTPPIADVLPGFAAISWHVMVAPPGTPAAISNNLSAAIAESLRLPDVTRQLAELGIEAIGSTPAEMAAFIAQERERFAPVIRASGISAE